MFFSGPRHIIFNLPVDERQIVTAHDYQLDWKLYWVCCGLKALAVELGKRRTPIKWTVWFDHMCLERHGRKFPVHGLTPGSMWVMSSLARMATPWSEKSSFPFCLHAAEFYDTPRSIWTSLDNLVSLTAMGSAWLFSEGTTRSSHLLRIQDTFMKTINFWIPCRAAAADVASVQ